MTENSSKPNGSSDLLLESSTCANCRSVLELPFVKCVTCQPHVTICRACFSMGAEFSNHENDHPYTVVKYDFSIYDPKWTAAEELRLLNAIIENGFGNWPAISSQVRTKTAAECESHYIKCYVESPQHPLPEFPDDHIADGGAPIVYKLSDNPPRPADCSPLWNDMGGYSAPRGDFNIEFDNYAEMDICQLTASDKDEDDDDDENEDNRDNDNSSSDNDKDENDDDDDDDQEEEKQFQQYEEMTRVEDKVKTKELYQDMKIAVLEVYRNCLKERQWRKNIVQKCGLINLRKWYGILKRRYERGLSFEFFRPFMRLFSSMTFDKHLDSLVYEKQLKSEILKLQEYRKNGLTRLGSVRTFHILRQRREVTKSKRHLLQDVLTHIKDEASAQTWLARQAVIDNPSTANSASFPLPRRKNQRLNIENLPGVEKLDAAERELCSTNRLVPQAYLDFSKILIAECSKHGCLQLAQARRLIKIDVNKTRKLYDFLILHGHINKDPI